MHCTDLTDDGSIALAFTKAERREIAAALASGDVRRLMDPAVVTLWRYLRLEDHPTG